LLQLREEGKRQLSMRDCLGSERTEPGEGTTSLTRTYDRLQQDDGEDGSAKAREGYTRPALANLAPALGTPWVPSVRDGR
jgi:hypothetical protein